MVQAGSNRAAHTEEDIMRITRTWLIAAAAAMAIACSNDNSPTVPATPDTTGTIPGTDTTLATTANVSVGDIFFQSAQNPSINPAVDTVAVNGTVTWTWAAGETLPHSVQSQGSPSFTSSGIQTGAGNTYAVTFTTPGTYQYDCAVHGSQMTGTIVVR
jgi:plastocyanin